MCEGEYDLLVDFKGRNLAMIFLKLAIVLLVCGRGSLIFKDFPKEMNNNGWKHE